MFMNILLRILLIWVKTAENMQKIIIFLTAMQNRSTWQISILHHVYSRENQVAISVTTLAHCLTKNLIINLKCQWDTLQETLFEQKPLKFELKTLKIPKYWPLWVYAAPWWLNRFLCSYTGSLLASRDLVRGLVFMLIKIIAGNDF